MTFAIAHFYIKNDKSDARIIKWGIKHHEKFYEHDDIKSFMLTMKKEAAAGRITRLYINDLDFFGHFFFDYALRNKLIYNTFTYDRQPAMSFRTLVNGKDSKKIYHITLKFTAAARFEIWDLSKILQWKLYTYPKNLGMEHIMNNQFYEDDSQELRDSMERDCEVIHAGMMYMLNAGYDTMTLGSSIFRDWKTARYPGIKKVNEAYREEFPVLVMEVDNFIRKAYKGGYVYLNEDYKDQVLENVTEYDINSLYPSVMMGNDYPYGQPIHFTGEPDGRMKLFIVRFKCEFYLKDGHYPTALITDGTWEYGENEYIIDSKGFKTLTMTSVDLNYFLMAYHHGPIEWVEGYYFRSKSGMFDDFIKIYNAQKENAPNKGIRTLNKLAMVTLYGRFGRLRENEEQVPIIGEDGKIEFDKTINELGDGEYTAIAAFITSYARVRLIHDLITLEPGQFVYCDTDSMHILGDLPAHIELEANEIGKYKLDFKSTKAKYLGLKTYMMVNDTDKKISISGLEKELQDKINFDQFELGYQIEGHRVTQVVPGGAIKKDISYTVTEKMAKFEQRKIFTHLERA